MGKKLENRGFFSLHMEVHMCIMRITAELSCREKEGMSMEYLIVDIITVVLGIYLLYAAVRMKKTGRINSLIANGSEIKNCRNKEGFINAIYMPTLLFGMISFAFGIFVCADKMLFHLNRVFKIGGVIVFFAGWLWFSRKLRIGKADFFH